MKPCIVLLLDGYTPEGKVAYIPTVEYRTEQHDYMDWKREEHPELSAIDRIDAIVNARKLAQQLGLPCAV